MNIITLLSQVVLPLSLIIWFYYVPTKNVLGFILQVLASTLVLFTISFISIWSLPPWWTPYLYLFVFWFFLVKHFYNYRFHFVKKYPDSVFAWTSLIFFTALGIVTGMLCIQALNGRALPESSIVNINFPLRSGNYLIAAGGAKELINQHLKTLNPDIQHFRAYRGQSYAVDIIKIDKLGFHTSKINSNNPADYASFGTPVYAPCNGSVIEAQKNRSDMSVGVLDLDHFLGNYLVIKCYDIHIVMAHFKENTLTVSPGDFVTTGIKLGEIGNSGRSFEPHLHIHAQEPASDEEPISGEPIHLSFNDIFPVRNQRFIVVSN